MQRQVHKWEAVGRTLDQECSKQCLLFVFSRIIHVSYARLMTESKLALMWIKLISLLIISLP